MAEKRISNLSIDAPLPIEPDYEDRILERLKNSPFTKKAFAAFLSKKKSPEADSRRLAQMLYDVVYCHEVNKADVLLESLAGVKAYKFKDAPKRIERFHDWVKPYIEFLRASGNTQDCANLLSELRDLTHLISWTNKMAARWYRSYPDSVRRLARFMEDKTDKVRLPSLVKFLHEVAALCQYNQSYSESSLFEIINPRKPKKQRVR